MGSVQLIYIRADGNKDIAAGHLMRCLTIAREILQKGHRVCFLVSDENSVSILSENEPDIVPVTDSKPFLNDRICVLRLQTANYRNPEQELPELTTLLQTHPGTILIDSYFVTEAYLGQLRSITKTAYIDDIRAFDYPVDLLVNYDCFSENSRTEYERTCQSASRMLLGAGYAPLRPQFYHRKITVKEFARDILITTGSSDPYHFALHFCEQLKSNANTTLLSDYRYHIVVGGLNSDKETLEQIAGELPFIQLYTGLTDLMPLMLTCDLAITAGGTTLYELCALGIPSISFSMADNQMINPTILDEQRIVPYAGDIRTQMDPVLDHCLDFIIGCASDYTKRETIHTRMNSLIKGNGASLIADAILLLQPNPK